MKDPSGLAHWELVEVYEEKLMEKKLLSPRSHGDRSGVIFGKYDRLTDLGYALCQFIDHYDTLREK